MRKGSFGAPEAISTQGKKVVREKLQALKPRARAGPGPGPGLGARGSARGWGRRQGEAGLEV